MNPLAWWIAANTVVTAFALVLAACAFLTYRDYMRQCRNVVQAHERQERRTEPHRLPLLCGDYEVGVYAPAPSGRHALDHTSHMPAVGTLPTAGGEVR